MRCFTSDSCDDFLNMLFNHKSQSTVATKLVDFLKTTMTDLTDADNAYENQSGGSQLGPQVIYKYVLKTTTTTGSDDDDIEPIDIALYVGGGLLGLIIVIVAIKGLLQYCVANGMYTFDEKIVKEVARHQGLGDEVIQEEIHNVREVNSAIEKLYPEKKF
ncbi:unnamed protein product [Bathycoccus prasinos]